jgi:lipopolysaccharide transport system ATP-binding protein
MNENVIEVKGISKEYKLGKVAKGSIIDTFRSLDNVSFKVKKGDVLGIVGKNGAGKSTLLKVLSKITHPSSGSAKIKGRVASLLEVGTGFHPELSGRENIFLNGAILGMTNKEIKGKFDEIVTFAGVEKFIDTPVKHYSSGMYVRLAFSVAAHLEPEILIIDEVLAVGDADFQRKCIGKMKDVAGEGRTVLFVSHNMAAVKSLCTKAIVLNNGTVVLEGTPEDAISYYLKGGVGEINNVLNFKDLKVDGEFSISKILIKNRSRSENDYIVEDDETILIIDLIMFNEDPEKCHLTFHLYNEMGDALFSFSSAGLGGAKLKSGKNKLECSFPTKFFQAGSYSLSLIVVRKGVKPLKVVDGIMTFNVIEGKREIGTYMGREPGFIRPMFNWKNLSEL